MIIRVIELNTFSNVWYWMAVIVTWAMASHWLIGVPFDLLFLARKATGQAVTDLEALVDINVRRIVMLDDLAGTWVVALGAFVLSVLGLTGFYYGIEIAQGIFALGAPLALVGLMNLRLARQLHQVPLAGKELVQRLFAVRLWTQVIGMLALFFTSMYGMYFNIHNLPFF